jgi:hypothetical protein
MRAQQDAPVNPTKRKGKGKGTRRKNEGGANTVRDGERAAVMTSSRQNHNVSCEGSGE